MAKIHLGNENGTLGQKAMGKFFNKTFYTITKLYCVESVRIRSFSGPYFPAFGVNTKRYGVYLRIHSKSGKM